MTLYAVYKTGPTVTIVPNTDKPWYCWLNGQEMGSEKENKAIWPENIPLSKLSVRCGINGVGYIFLCFSTTEDGSGIVTDSWYPTKDMTLYAIFAEGSTQNFHPEPGVFSSTGESYYHVQVLKGEVIGEVETPVQEGKIFLGWQNYQTKEMIDPKTYVPTAGYDYVAIWADKTQDFKDVEDEAAWFYNIVYQIASTTNAKGTSLMSGYKDGSGKFGPADPLTRQDFAVILYRLAEEPDVTVKENPFPDADPNGYYFESIVWAKENSIIGGYEDGRFGVGDNITREQVATILYRYAKDLLKLDTETAKAEGNLKVFKDYKSVSPFAKDALAWANGAGIITGKDNGTRIDPQGNAARAEIGAMILRFQNYLGK